MADVVRQRRRTPGRTAGPSDEEADIIMGLDIGADDYIKKPFKLAVFLSRINALLRRSDNFSRTDAELCSNGIRVQRLKGEVYKNGELLELTANEYKLLCLFMENPNAILSAEQILGRLWDCDESFVYNNALTLFLLHYNRLYQYPFGCMAKETRAFNLSKSAQSAQVIFGQFLTILHQFFFFHRKYGYCRFSSYSFPLGTGDKDRCSIRSLFMKSK